MLISTSSIWTQQNNFHLFIFEFIEWKYLNSLQEKENRSTNKMQILQMKLNKKYCSFLKYSNCINVVSFKFC